ncbi:hypothetical protein ACLI4U_19195 (plasmid) [Natrialbaceae archaeon A-CW2]
MESEASMKDLHNGPYKSDDVSQDTCPTCGAGLDTKATHSAAGHNYRLTCQRCPWQLPIERQQVPIADGGTAAATPQTDDPSAREILDELHYDESVARVCAFLSSDTDDLEANDLRRTLALADGELCFEFAHAGQTEYVAIAEDWQTFQSCYYRTGDAHVCGPVELEASDLENRLANLEGVCLLEDAPALIGGEA